MRNIRFRFWDKDLKKMIYRKPAYNDFSHPNIIPLQFTGFTDKFGIDIYEGDILSDWVKTDEGLIKSHNQVFWNEFTASYHLDHSFNQDKSSSRELWQEINDFKYEISGNIYQNPELIEETK